MPRSIAQSNGGKVKASHAIVAVAELHNARIACSTTCHHLLCPAWTAFSYSVVFTLTALGAFGFVKGKFTGVSKINSALQTGLVGGAAAGVAYALAMLIS